MTVKKKAKKVVKKTTTKKAVKKTTTAKKIEARKKLIKNVKPIGRPSEYDPKFCDIVIEQMSLGFSKEAVAGFIGISKNTLYRWADEHEAFRDALSIGNSKSQYIWEKKAVDFAVHTKNGKQINAQVYNLNMKNRFGWADKIEQTTDDGKGKEKKTFAFTLDAEPAKDDE